MPVLQIANNAHVGLTKRGFAPKSSIAHAFTYEYPPYVRLPNMIHFNSLSLFLTIILYFDLHSPLLLFHKQLSFPMMSSKHHY